MTLFPALNKFIDKSNVLFSADKKPVVMQFKNIKNHEDIAVHSFTTRLGGVSEGECSSFNLGFNRNDKKDNVLQNYKLLAECMGIKVENMVLSNQIHDSKVKIVVPDDCGKGIIRHSDIIGYDGLITNHRGVAIVTFYADCVPVFFLDPVKKVIAVVHSGWRGTVKEIAAVAVSNMTRQFNCRHDDIIASIGPSIGQCCFETGEEVYKEFCEIIPWSIEYCSYEDKNKKWYFDLKSIIKTTLLRSGINSSNISVADICTKCNKDVFFSHRGDNGKTGSMAAVMQLI